VPFRVVMPEAAAPTAAAGQLNVDPSVIAAIRSASAQSGTRFDVMLASATLESGLNPTAQASGSSAKGLFQFVDQTWLQAVRQYGPSHGLGAEAAAVVRRGAGLTVEDPALRQRILDLRDNPTIASELAGDHLRGITDKLTQTLGRPPDAPETYLGHFLGGGGASQMLQALQSTPNRPAADLLPEAAGANPSMFRSANGAPYSVEQFMAHLRARVAGAYAALGSAMPKERIGVADLQPSPAGADPAEIGASGWGASRSLHSKRAMETQVMASLTAVFTRLDQDTQQGRQRRSRGLPPAVLSALRSMPDS
jgi:hypothetical protein